MLREIRIKNFKSLRDTGYLEIKPITILIGPNNSGKSSLIQFLLLLKQTVESPDRKNALVYNDPNCVQLEAYENIIWKNDTNNTLEFEFVFEKNMPKKHFPPLPRVKSKIFCKFPPR